jgi:AAA ATPase domain/Domain of unknown function (DUF4062)
MNSAFRVFISCVSKEFRSYRKNLRDTLTTSGREIKIQEDFHDGPGTLLEKLDHYISHCQAVIHLVGSSTGEVAKAAEVRWLLQAYGDFASVMPELAPWLNESNCPFSYTQWECFLALYHRVPCFIYRASETSERENDWVLDTTATAAQAEHVTRLRALGQDRRILDFADPRDVALRFLNSYYADGGQAPAMTSGSVYWPVLSQRRHYALADRENEFATLRSLLNDDSPHRIVGVHGPSDYGKSVLLLEFFRFMQTQTGILCAYAEFKGALPLTDVLHDLRRDLRAARFSRFDRYRESGPAEMLRKAFLLDLEECVQPVVLVLDTLEQATDDARDWVLHRLLPLCSTTSGIRVILGGQTMPDLGANRRLADWVRAVELRPIRDPAPWCEYGRRVLGISPKILPDDHIGTLVRAAQGSPRAVHTLLSNIKSDAGLV